MFRIFVSKSCSAINVLILISLILYPYLWHAGEELNLRPPPKWWRSNTELPAYINQDDWIRTNGHLLPRQVRYQTALHPVYINANFFDP